MEVKLIDIAKAKEIKNGGYVDALYNHYIEMVNANILSRSKEGKGDLILPAPRKELEERVYESLREGGYEVIINPKETKGSKIVYIKIVW